MSKQDPVVIVDLSRTPMGGFQGALADATAAELGAAAIASALKRAGVDTEDVQEVLMGCVLPAGQGQAPARQAALGADLSLNCGCTTINKMCGSGMKAVMMAHDSLSAGSNDVMVAGGMESMTNAPYLAPRVRAGLRMGHAALQDHMFLDGLEDAYDKGKLMGVFAEATASRYNFTREAQDEFAIRSLNRAKVAIDNGSFAKELSPYTVKGRKGDTVVDTDEQPPKANLEKIPTLRAAFAKDGTVTAANSSSISDGAAALVLMRRSEAEKRGVKWVATILAHESHAHEPQWFTTAPVDAVKRLLTKIDKKADEIDLYEINEAFAVVTMAGIHDLSLDVERVNIHGGACALGHPIGASGARIMVTLVNALRIHGLKTGIAALCIGGGEATAMAIELAE